MTSTRSSLVQSALKLKVLEWKKLDVLASMAFTPSTIQPQSGGPERKVVDPTAFAPSTLSKTALTLTEDILQAYKPDHILVERQRFRSGGAAAVQEWTLRVNMLESMIWACLTTLRASSKASAGLE